MQPMETAADFTEGRIAGKLIKFMLPILGALVLQAAYGAVDVLMVGWFGTTEGLSGVSTGSSIINLVTFVLTGLATGITVLLGNFIGSRNTERAGKMVGSAILFFVIVSVVLTVLLIVLAEPVARLMKAPEEAVDNTVMYVRICGGGILFIVAYNVISCILRGIGNSRLPLIFVAIACVANIIGDYTLIAIFHMDEAGAAIATVGAQAISVILSLMILRKQKLPFTIRLKDSAVTKIFGSGFGGTGVTLAELRTKEVIDVHDGKRLGRVMDIEFCTADSRVTALVVPAETSFLQSLRGEKCGLVIPWEDIQRIGDDVILVSTKCSCACRQDGTHWE